MFLKFPASPWALMSCLLLPILPTAASVITSDIVGFKFEHLCGIALPPFFYQDFSKHFNSYNPVNNKMLWPLCWFQSGDKVSPLNLLMFCLHLQFETLLVWLCEHQLTHRCPYTFFLKGKGKLEERCKAPIFPAWFRIATTKHDPHSL